MTPRTAEYPRPNHFILHLSDTHLLANGQLYDRVDSEARLRRVFEDLERSGARPEAIIFTGDLADKGEPIAYGRLRSIIDPAARRLGAQTIWVMGNHDERAAFRTMLLGQFPSTEPIDRVYFVNGLRIVTLDTSVPGQHYGHLESSQLDWLTEELATPAPHGTILAMHHPPVPCVLDLAVTVELREQGALAEVLKGTDVRSIIAGHLHYSTNATFAGIPVSVASASCYTQDLAAPVGATRARDGAQAYNLIHVYDHTIMHTVVPVGDSTVLQYVSPEETARRLALDEIVIPPSNIADERYADAAEAMAGSELEQVTWELTSV
jgi:3',5'-cyclic AMP phosphodiesterase CpdA